MHPDRKIVQDIDISPIVSDEIYQIMPVMQAAFDPAYGEAWTVSQCCSTLLLPGSCLFAARAEGHVTGFAMTMTVLDSSELLLLAVLPHLQKRGIGQALMVFWENQAISRGAKSLFLEVREGNPAMNFYRDKGFDIIGTRPSYYKMKDGTAIAAQTMRKFSS